MKPKAHVEYIDGAVEQSTTREDSTGKAGGLLSDPIKLRLGGKELCELALVKVGDTLIVSSFKQMVRIWREMVDEIGVSEKDSWADLYEKLVS